MATLGMRDEKAINIRHMDHTLLLQDLIHKIKVIKNFLLTSNDPENDPENDPNFREAFVLEGLETTTLSS